MKTNVLRLIWAAAAYAAIYIVLAQTVLQFPTVFALAIVGHGFVLYMAYAILTDPYKATGKFKHWYKDNPRM